MPWVCSTIIHLRQAQVQVACFPKDEPLHLVRRVSTLQGRACTPLLYRRVQLQEISLIAIQVRLFKDFMMQHGRLTKIPFRSHNEGHKSPTMRDHLRNSSFQTNSTEMNTTRPNTSLFNRPLTSQQISLGSGPIKRGNVLSFTPMRRAASPMKRKF